MQVFAIQLSVITTLTFGSTALVFLPTAKLLRIKTMKSGVMLAGLLFIIAFLLIGTYVGVGVTRIR